jgi:hypothetical protein
MALSVAATAIALGALAVSLYQALLARRNHAFAREAFNDDRRAWPSIEPHPPALHGPDSVVYAFAMRNAGRAYARHLQGWIENRSGERFGQWSTVRPAIGPGEAETINIVVTVAEASSLREAWLELRWDDWQRDGQELQPSSRRVPFDPAPGWAREHLQRARSRTTP